MKHKAATWLGVLVATHVFAFQMARPESAGSGTDAGGTAAKSGITNGKSEARTPAGKAHREALEELQAAGLSREEFVKLREELFRDWIAKDLEGAMDMIYGAETCGRYGDVGLKLSYDLHKAMEARPLDSWKWIASGRYGSNRIKASEEWIFAQTFNRRYEPVLAALPEMTSKERKEAIESICSHGMKEDLKALREAAGDGAFVGHTSFESPGSDYAERIFRLAGDDLRGSLEGESSDHIQRILVRAWAGNDKRSARDTLAVVAELPADLRRESFQALFGDSRRGGFAAVVELLEETQRAGLWPVPTEDHREDREDLIHRAVEAAHMRYSQPAEICRELLKISDPEVRRLAFKSAGAQFDLEDTPGELREALAGMAKGPETDAFIESVLRNSGRHPGFEELAARLSNDALKQEFLKEEEEEDEDEP